MSRPEHDIDAWLEHLGQAPAKEAAFLAPDGEFLQDDLFNKIQMLDGGAPSKKCVLAPDGEFLQDDLFNKIQMLDGGTPPVPKSDCEAPDVRGYIRIDSSEGPGWMSDSYRGECCASCGRVIREKKIY